MQRINACRVCGDRNIGEILDLGQQPYANSLLRDPDEKEEFYPLSLSWCPGCSLVQLNETAEPGDLFSNYVWVTSTSQVALEHARKFYREIERRTLIPETDYVLEVASNDGAFLKPFLENGHKVLGVDPARNIVDTAVANGIASKCSFFGMKAAEEIVDNCGRARVVIARNVLPHVANLLDFVEGLRLCLKDDGLLAIEFHYAKVIYEGLHYDSVYHEHLCYFTLKSVEALLNRFDLFVTDIGESPISGGSLILYLRKGHKKESPAVLEYRDSEERAGVNSLSSWEAFAGRVYSHRDRLVSILTEIVEETGPLAGYGASARSSTLLNFCHIDGRLISVIADQNAMKQGCYTAGTHIPIASPEEVMKRKPKSVIILAWNFADEISRILTNRFSFIGNLVLPLPNKPRCFGPGGSSGT